MTTDTLHRAFTKASVPMMIVDRAGHCVEANESLSKMLGLRRSALVRRSLDSLFKVENSSGATALVPEMLKKNSVQRTVRFNGKGKFSVSLVMKGFKLTDAYFLISLGPKEATEVSDLKLWRLDKSTMIVPEFFPLPSEDEGKEYQALFQQSPYGISIIQNDKIVLANPMFCKLLGYRSSEDVLGREMRQFLDEGSRMFFSLLEHRVFRGETIPSRFEIRMMRENGSAIDVETSFGLTGHKGAPAINLSVNDITDRKELEKRLMDSEGLLRNVINSMVDALVITDLQGKVLDVNDEFQRFTGFTRREAFGSEIPYPWVPEEDLRSYISWLEKLRVNNVLRDFDMTWLRKTEERVAVSLNTTLLRNSSGEPVLMVNIARDISEREASRAELSRQLQRLQVLYDLSSALTETFDTQEIARITYHQIGKVIPVDAFFIDLYDEPQKLLRPIFNVDVVDDTPVEMPVSPSPVPLDSTMASYKVINGRKPLLELRKTPHDKPGYLPFGKVERASASLMFVPMFSKVRTIGIMSVQSYTPNMYSADQLALLQSIANLVGIAIEKANLYQETIKKSEEIESRNKELDDFTYVVSHDLKEPLISVEGYAKMIKHEYLHLFDDVGKDYLESVIDSCSYMKKLIDDLLLLSRISKVAEKKVQVNLSNLIAEVLEELQFSVRERKAEIILQKDWPNIVGVDTHLRIVFRNLISNALKFCDKTAPRIEIGATATTESTTVFVRDNGIGIEEAYFDKIFLIFQRLHRKDEYEGAGAGLAIVKKIIELQGGRIWVESQSGKGSTFFFTIPTV